MGEQKRELKVGELCYVVGNGGTASFRCYCSLMIEYTEEQLLNGIASRSQKLVLSYGVWMYNMQMVFICRLQADEG